VQYTDDFNNWKIAGQTIVGTGSRMVWEDPGPPVTAAHPATLGARLYRLEIIP
jgi:hypothetical protein